MPQNETDPLLDDDIEQDEDELSGDHTYDLVDADDDDLADEIDDDAGEPSGDARSDDADGDGSDANTPEHHSHLQPRKDGKFDGPPAAGTPAAGTAAVAAPDAAQAAAAAGAAAAPDEAPEPYRFTVDGQPMALPGSYVTDTDDVVVTKAALPQFQRLITAGQWHLQNYHRETTRLRAEHDRTVNELKTAQSTEQREAQAWLTALMDVAKSPEDMRTFLADLPNRMQLLDAKVKADAAQAEAKQLREAREQQEREQADEQLVTAQRTALATEIETFGRANNWSRDDVASAFEFLGNDLYSSVFFPASGDPVRDGGQFQPGTIVFNRRLVTQVLTQRAQGRTTPPAPAAAPKANGGAAPTSEAPAARAAERSNARRAAPSTPRPVRGAVRTTAEPASRGDTQGLPDVKPPTNAEEANEFLERYDADTQNKLIQRWTREGRLPAALR